MNKVRKAWEIYHGQPINDGISEPYIPVTPPIFMRGYADGYDHAKGDAVKYIDELMDSVSDLLTQDQMDELERLHKSPFPV